MANSQICERMVIRFTENDQDFLRSLPLMNVLLTDEEQYDETVTVPFPVTDEKALRNYRNATQNGYLQVICEVGGNIIATAGLRELYDPLKADSYFEINNHSNSG